jgi:hypothetical protein
MAAGLLVAGLTPALGAVPGAGRSDVAASAATAAEAGAEPGAAAGAGLAADPYSEADDFPYPGADTMVLPNGSNEYVTYGASSGGRTVPYTISGSGDVPAPSATVTGDAWKGVVFPSGYWAKTGSGIWTPGAWTMVKGGTRYYYLFYTAVKAGTDDKHCVGVAKATQPGGPFHPQADALACPSRDTRWAIDADVTQKPGGAIWMTWRDGERAKEGGRDSALSVMMLKFSDDGTVSRNSDPVVMLGTEQLTWPAYQDSSGVIVIENPSAAFINGSWYLFYSGNSFTGPYYATGIAYCGATIDHRCTPMPGPNKAYFAYSGPSDGNTISKPDSCDPTGVRPLNTTAYPADMRVRGLPGNKRSIGAMDVYTARDGEFWVTWNYRSDSNWCARKSRVGHLHISGSGADATFTVSLT